VQRADKLVIAVASLGCQFSLGGCSLLFVESAADATDVDAAVELDAIQQPQACAGMLATFEGLAGNNAPLLQHAGLDFRGTWGSYVAGQFNVPSASIAFDTDRATGDFGFETGERILRGLRVFRSDVPVTLTISDGTNPDLEVSLDSETTTADVTTNWTTPSGQIQISSTANWQFFLDDICHSAP
jgi:hypothetical protein